MTYALPALERDILMLIAAGGRDPEIAKRLKLSTVGRVAYRVSRIASLFGVEMATRPQLVHLAYIYGVLPRPALEKPVLLPAEQELLLRAHTDGRIALWYYRAAGLTRAQGAHIALKGRRTLSAATIPHLVQRAWARQILGASQFTADVEWMRTHLAYQPLIDEALIVPISRGEYRLAVPVHGAQRRAGWLALQSHSDALAVAAFLRNRAGFPSLRMSDPATSADPFVVTWGEQPPSARTTTPRFYGYHSSALRSPVRPMPPTACRQVLVA